MNSWKIILILFLLIISGVLGYLTYYYENQNKDYWWYFLAGTIITFIIFIIILVYFIKEKTPEQLENERFREENERFRKNAIQNLEKKRQLEIQDFNPQEFRELQERTKEQLERQGFTSQELQDETLPREVFGNYEPSTGEELAEPLGFLKDSEGNFIKDREGKFIDPDDYRNQENYNRIANFVPRDENVNREAYLYKLRADQQYDEDKDAIYTPGMSPRERRERVANFVPRLR